MSVKAVWHSGTTTPADVDEDPFGDVPSAVTVATPVSVPSVGLPIDLGGDEASLSRRLVELLDKEAQLDAEGLTCELKWDRQVTCLACPLGDKGPLCALGREQETVSTTLAVRRHGERRQ